VDKRWMQKQSYWCRPCGPIPFCLYCVRRFVNILLSYIVNIVMCCMCCYCAGNETLSWKKGKRVGVFHRFLFPNCSLPLCVESANSTFLQTCEGIIPKIHDLL
jgi:hypothetical protein